MSAPLIRVYVNGEPLEVPEGTQLPRILELAGREPALTVVTVDGKFVPRSEYGACRPAEGARVRAWELLGGG